MPCGQATRINRGGPPHSVTLCPGPRTAAAANELTRRAGDKAELGCVLDSPLAAEGVEPPATRATADAAALAALARAAGAVALDAALAARIPRVTGDEEQEHGDQEEREASHR